MAGAIEHVPEAHRESARNLVHYVALRQLDLRELQLQLAQLGLSSLGRSESCVHGAACSRCRDACTRRSRFEGMRPRSGSWPVSTSEAQRRALVADGQVLPAPAHARRARTEARRPAHLHHGHGAVRGRGRPGLDARDAGAGMNVLRINCAHEGPERVGARRHGAPRGAARDGPRVPRAHGSRRPEDPDRAASPGPRTSRRGSSTKDELGRVTAPARVVVRRPAAPPIDEAPVPCSWSTTKRSRSLRQGRRAPLRDARGKKRSLHVHEVSARRGRRRHATERALRPRAASRTGVPRGSADRGR